MCLFNRSKRNQPGGDRGSLADNNAGVARPSGTSHSYHHLGASGNVVSSAMSSTSLAVAKTVSSSSSAVTKVPPQQQQPPLQQTVAVGATAESHHNHSKSHHSSVLQDVSDANSTGPSQSTPSIPSQRSDSDDNSFRQSKETLTSKEPMPPR